jgi:predicted transglutaminase-like cysteine proteinase
MKELLATLIALLVLLTIGAGLMKAVDGPPEAPLAIDGVSGSGGAAQGIDTTPPAAPVAAPQRPVKTITAIPVDAVARAKFPNEDPRLVDGIGYINHIVNSMIQGVSDPDHYGVDNKMVSEPDDGKGDCEDYALSKMVILGRSGAPIVWMARLRSVMVHMDDGQAYGHAILEVRLPKGGIAFLDNLHADLMTRAELKAHGYEFFDW